MLPSSTNTLTISGVLMHPAHIDSISTRKLLALTDWRIRAIGWQVIVKPVSGEKVVMKQFHIDNYAEAKAYERIIESLTLTTVMN